LKLFAPCVVLLLTPWTPRGGLNRPTTICNWMKTMTTRRIEILIVAQNITMTLEFSSDEQFEMARESMYRNLGAAIERGDVVVKVVTDDDEAPVT